MTAVESIITGLIVLAIGAYMTLLTRQVSCKVNKDLFETTNKAVEKELDEGRQRFREINAKQDQMLITLHSLDTTTQLIQQTLTSIVSQGSHKKGGES